MLKNTALDEQGTVEIQVNKTKLFAYFAGKHSTAERRVLKFSRRQREMTRQMTEDSAKTISSSMDAADTTHR